jgi:predicted  nucleic acid-binding Zn-ribbon protein
MANLKIRNLHIEIVAGDGVYGTDLDFEDGLNVIRAENTSGKTSCINAIVFALGLEGALGPRREIPLTPAVTREIRTEDGLENVLQSQVWLTIENGAGSVARVRRTVVGRDVDNRLVNVSLLSGDGSETANFDTFVTIPGSAQRDLGFHHWLAEFVGWELPRVPRFQGGTCPLYIEILWTLLFVEQRRGWASIQANMPTYYGVKDASERSIEFINKMDAYDIQVRKQNLYEQSAECKREWRAAIDHIRQIAGRVNGVVQGLPDSPVYEWPGEYEVKFLLHDGVDWQEFKEVYNTYHSRLRETDDKPEDDPEQQELTSRLESLREDLKSAEYYLQEKFSEYTEKIKELEQIENRLSRIAEDLEKYKDIKTLRKLGSSRKLAIDNDTCPTCHQELSSELLRKVGTTGPMTVEQNETFLRNQLATFRNLESGTKRHIEILAKELAVTRERVQNLRAEIREVKRSLVGPEGAISYMQARQRLQLEDALDRMEKTKEELDQGVAGLGPLAEKFREIEQERLSLPSDDLTEKDHDKLRRILVSLREQMEEYGFSSFEPEKLDIDLQSYKPMREGYDIGFEASASDNVRLVWGYLYALMELARKYETNHPGFLIMDEPKQQDTKILSFRYFLKRAAQSKVHGQQVIIGTSESESEVRSFQESADFKWHNFKSDVFQKMRALKS